MHPVRFNQLDLVVQQRQSPKATLNLPPLALGKRSAVTGAHVVQLVGPFAAPDGPHLADAVQGQQPTDARDDPGSLPHKITPFARQATRIFLLRRWHRNRPAHARVAREIRLQNANHSLGINAVGFDSLPAPRNQKASRSENVNVDPFRQQHPGNRETIIADHEAQADRQTPLNLARGPVFELLQMGKQRGAVPSSNLAKRQPRTFGELGGNKPTSRAKLKAHINRGRFDVRNRSVVHNLLSFRQAPPTVCGMQLDLHRIY